MSMGRKKTKVIRVDKEIYEALLDLGTMRDTFNDVIQRLMKDAQKWRVFEKEVLRDIIFFAEVGSPDADKETGTYKEWKEKLTDLNLVDEDILRQVLEEIKEILEKERREG